MLPNHAYVKDTFKVHGRPMDFNAIDYERCSSWYYDFIFHIVVNF